MHAVLGELRGKLQARTCNGALVALNSLLKSAKRDGYLTTLPTLGVERFKTEQKKRRLYGFSEIQKVCEKALEVSKNGLQLADYIWFLAFCGGESAKDGTGAPSEQPAERTVLRILVRRWGGPQYEGAVAARAPSAI